MQFVQFVTRNIGTIFWSSSFVLSNILLISYYVERQNINEKYKNILGKKIISLEEALQRTKEKQFLAKEETYLVKVYPKKRDVQKPIMKVQNKLPSNQLWLLEPSLNYVCKQAINSWNNLLRIQPNNSMSYRLQDRKHKWEVYPKWRAGSGSDSKCQLTQIEGLGQIACGQIFDIKTYYLPLENKSFFTSLLQNVAYFLQKYVAFPETQPEKDSITISQYYKKLALNEFRAPFFKGPIVGTVLYLFDFITNRPLLLQARIEDNKIIPVMISSSKLAILQFLDKRLCLVNFCIFLSAFVTYISYNMARPSLRKLFRNIKNRLKRVFKKRILVKQVQVFRAVGQTVDDNLICIICYTNCRNTILLNCRHMIMCDECKQSYKESQCPLCKREIQDDKVLVLE